MSEQTDFNIILLAEDDPDDQYLIGEAIDECHLGVRVFIVKDGEDLLDYLRHEGQYTDVEQWPRPSLILLDLNMPRKDGREALEEIKQDEELRRIPVIVLTTSKAEEDLVNTYNLGVSGFITKPASFNDLRGVIKSLGTYWLKVVTLPPE